MIDLHTHSVASDGQYTARELLTRAKDIGITTFAITDHDAIGELESGMEVAKELGIRFIPGIEISVQSSEEMHILGYYIDPRSEGMKAACDRFVKLRDERAERIIDFLHSKGVNISLEDVRKKAGDNVIARPHFAQVILEQGYIDNYRDAFNKYLATDEFAKIERPKPSPQEGIQMIHNAGGIAVLAHPMSLKLRDIDLEKQIKELVDAGLDGIETYYGSHSASQIEEYHSLAVKYGLSETTGSDFHGEKVKPEQYLGMRDGGQVSLVDEKTEERIVDSLEAFSK